MDIKDHVFTAWQACLDHFTPLLMLTLVLFAASIASFGILAPAAFAGYTDALHRLLIFNRKPRIRDVFSQFSLFFPLFIFSLTVFIVSLIGFTLFFIPGILFLAVVGYTCLYMIPLMVDRKFGLIDAVKKSTAIVTTRPVTDHLAAFFIFYALTTIGGSSFIGFLVLQPFASLFLLSVYRTVG